MKGSQVHRSPQALCQLFLGGILGALAIAIPAFLVLGGSTKVALAKSAAQQAGCQFSILEFKDCLSGNCAEYEVPLKNTANEPLTVGGRVEMQGPNNVVIATQELPQTTVPANGEITVSGRVCASGPLPEGPYKFEVFIQDIPRSCEEKHKSQPLSDRCAEATVSPTGTALPAGTATSTPGKGTPKPNITATASATPQPKVTETGTALPKGTGTGTVVPVASGTTTVVPVASETGTVMPSTSTPEATAIAGGFGNSATATAAANALAETGPGSTSTTGGLKGMPRTGSPDSLGALLMLLALFSTAMVGLGTFMRKRQLTTGKPEEDSR
jgi:hypothetical protein